MLPAAGPWRPVYADPDTRLNASLVPEARATSAVDMAIVYYGRIREGHSLISSTNRLWDGAIWRAVERSRVVAKLGPQTVELDETVIRSLSERRLIWSFYWMDGRFTTSNLTIKLLQLKTAFTGNEASALIAFSTPIDGAVEDARARLKTALASFGDLPKYLVAEAARTSRRTPRIDSSGNSFMCGIAGWFDTAGERPADRALVRAMTDAIRHRGPDGEGFHYGPGIGLGHRRLAIIDLATGDQPMFNADRTVAIVFNGEIYNFRELKQELIARNHRFSTASDTEVIIHAWEEWGEACVEHLAGMFAFALWDEPKRTLFLARDRLGEKPLYYSLLPDQTLIFGSELKALLVHPDLARRIDPCAVEEFFALGYIAEPRTIYEDVLKLPAGTCLTVQRGRQPRLRSYWDPHPAALAGRQRRTRSPMR